MQLPGGNGLVIIDITPLSPSLKDCPTGKYDDDHDNDAYDSDNDDNIDDNDNDDDSDDNDNDDDNDNNDDSDDYFLNYSLYI